MKTQTKSERITVDGNEAAARVAHRTNEVIAIYPITPASPMGELSDLWSSRGQPNLWGQVPQVIEMQSEGGAAGAVHGALQAGALTTTFTASQGLLLMLPNMYKIAGELTPTVFHVAARAVATHALSIFGDHSDVMSARQTGWAMLCSGSVQEAHDFALIAQIATLHSRIPFLHFFDGFRTSHELNQIHPLDDDAIRALLPADAIAAHRSRALDPDRPVLRGSAQNPDVFFQAREAVQPFYDEAPGLVREAMDAFAERTGRRYGLFDYEGAPDAERVIVLMGSGSAAAAEAVRRMYDSGEKVGVLRVRLYRPFDTAAFAAALPESTRAVVVLDRTKEPGAVGEPLFQDVVAALRRERRADVEVLGGRYGLGQKEFTPAMAAAALDELRSDEPIQGFTVGIVDDVSHSSLRYEADRFADDASTTRALFFGLGSDGTVGASKSTVEILAHEAGLWTQGYFVYDSKKAGSVTVSHVRIADHPIDAPYQIERANFVACHQFEFLRRIDVLAHVEPGGTLLLNAPYGPDELWDALPPSVQAKIRALELKVFAVDADKLAVEAGLGRRINTVMQTCFFALSELLPREEAVAAIHASIDKKYARAGHTVLQRNHDAVDLAADRVFQLQIGDAGDDAELPPLALPDDAPDFVARVTRLLLEGKGDLLPVSAMPVDGSFPTGTARFEKRSIAREIPIWDPDVCIQCGLCALVCPHAAIRTKAFTPADAERVADVLPSRPGRGKEYADLAVTIQVAPDDCTGCAVCVEVCPAFLKEKVSHKAINMEPKHEHLDRERERFETFLGLEDPGAREVDGATVKSSQRIDPLFEYSGACAGCGETPYLKLLSQLFGDRDCSSPMRPVVRRFTAATCRRRRGRKNAEGNGPGMVEFTVRGQRRIRSRHAYRGSTTTNWTSRKAMVMKLSAEYCPRSSPTISSIRASAPGSEIDVRSRSPGLPTRRCTAAGHGKS